MKRFIPQVSFHIHHGKHKCRSKGDCIHNVFEMYTTQVHSEICVIMWSDMHASNHTICEHADIMWRHTVTKNSEHTEAPFTNHLPYWCWQIFDSTLYEQALFVHEENIVLDLWIYA